VAGAPLTFGVVRPTIVLSPGLEGRELAAVLAHEGVHARRRDNLWHYAAALALILYWWNPAVWLMARLLRRDVELSCDRAAAASMSRHERAEYARAILNFSTQAEGLPFCRHFGQKQAEERIIAMLNYKKLSIVGAALSLALVGTLGTALATAPKAETEAEPMNAECFGTISSCEFDGVDVTNGSKVETGVVVSLDDSKLQRLSLEDYVELVKERTDEQVKNGGMTQAEADECVKAIENIWQKIGDGVVFCRAANQDAGWYTIVFREEGQK